MPEQSKHPGRKSPSIRLFRRVHTAQEKRKAQDGWARAKRNFRHLQAECDSRPRHQDRCWKHSRQTQYRETR